MGRSQGYIYDIRVEILIMFSLRTRDYHEDPGRLSSPSLTQPMDYPFFTVNTSSIRNHTRIKLEIDPTQQNNKSFFFTMLSFS